MDNLSWLQDWYAAQCDGEWEHQQGIAIDTLDNPGWSLKVNLSGTAYAELQFQTVEREGDDDWFVCRVRDKSFEGFGGTKNLEEMIGIFRSWISKASS